MSQIITIVDIFDVKYIYGGNCQCNCNRVISSTNIVDDSYPIGKARTLEECSQVCIENGWKIDSCNIPMKKEKEQGKV